MPDAVIGDLEDQAVVDPDAEHAGPGLRAPCDVRDRLRGDTVRRHLDSRRQGWKVSDDLHRDRERVAAAT